MSDADPHAGRQYLLRKLESLAALSDQDADAIRSLAMAVETYPAGHVLIREWDTPRHCHVLLDGFASRYKSLPDGGRQVLSFHTPGDILDLQGLYLGIMDYGVSTLVPTTVGHIPRTGLQALADNHPGLARAFLRDTLVDAAIYREWMLGLGRRTARTHLAHLLCEMVMRLRVVLPSADERAHAMPLVHGDLADALGLTVIEVNRELHALQQEGLIAVEGSFVVIGDYPGLAGISGFDPTYLHQDGAA